MPGEFRDGPENAALSERFDLSVSATSEAIAAVGDAISETLVQLEVPEQKRLEIALAVQEALALRWRRVWPSVAPFPSSAAGRIERGRRQPFGVRRIEECKQRTDDAAEDNKGEIAQRGPDCGWARHEEAPFCDERKGPSPSLERVCRV